MMKGQNPIVSHAIIVALSILMIFFIGITFNSIKQNHIGFLLDKESKVICSMVVAEALKIYRNESYVPPENKTMGWEKIYLENRLMGYPYKVYFNERHVFVKVHNKETNCTLPLNVSLHGSSYGGNTNLTWIRLPNGTDEIIMG